MRKLIYITDIDKLKEIGVYKKIISQCNVFSNYYETILLCQENYSICIENITYKRVERIDNFFSKIGRHNDKLSYLIEEYIRLYKINSFVFNFIKDSKPAVIYVRKYNLFIKGLNYIRYAKKTLDCKAICEIPTYPYKEEFFQKRRYLSYAMNKFFDYMLEKTVDKIAVILGQDIKLKSNKFMPISNGVDVYKIKPKEKNEIPHYINLIGVANIAFWHGYDRLIKGLKNYYDTKNKINTIVYFNVVGDSAELSNLKQLVSDYNLNDYIIFHGRKTGQELNVLFDKCNIGIGSLGNHRKALTKDSALKNREYCARGIPFLIASTDDGFGEDFKYILRIRPDESPVDVNKVIEFYNLIENDNYVEEMRDFAEKYLTWQAVMKPVIDVISSKI
jgi:glycosyltransferase involved in cell wall biosynthesis